MEEIIDTLFGACQRVGIATGRRFSDVQAFRDHLHRTLSKPGQTLSRRQLLLLQDAIIRAAHRDENAVVECIEQMKAA